MLERGDGVGGTWHYNTYPGCACDVPSNLYSFSFAPNPDWSRTYSRQPEIRAYLERVVDRFGVRPKIRLNTEVTGAAWNERRGAGGSRPRRARSRAKVLVSGTGPLVEPKIPDFPGLERFAGRRSTPRAGTTPSTCAGKRVALDRDRRLGDPVRPRDRARRRAALRLPAHAAVGDAAQRAAGHARSSGASTGAFPAAQRALRGGIYAARELLVLGFVKQPRGDEAARDGRAQAHASAR